MQDAVIVAARRTPIGKFLGSFAAISAAELGGVAVRAAAASVALKPEAVDAVIFGCARQAGNGLNIARQNVRRAGLPDAVPAFTVNEACTSGLNWDLAERQLDDFLPSRKFARSDLLRRHVVDASGWLKDTRIYRLGKGSDSHLLALRSSGEVSISTSFAEGSQAFVMAVLNHVRATTDHERLQAARLCIELMGQFDFPDGGSPATIAVAYELQSLEHEGGIRSVRFDGFSSRTPGFEVEFDRSSRIHSVRFWYMDSRRIAIAPTTPSLRTYYADDTNVRRLIFVMAVALSATMACCHSPYMRDAAPGGAPGPGEARVLFYRPSIVGGAVRIDVFEGERLLGVSEYDSVFEYRFPPAGASS